MDVCGLYAADLVIHTAPCENFMRDGILPPGGRAMSGNSTYGRFLLGSSKSGSLGGGGGSTTFNHASNRITNGHLPGTTP